MFKKIIQLMWRKRRRPSKMAEATMAADDQPNRRTNADYATVFWAKHRRHNPPLPPPATRRERWVRVGFALLVSPQMVNWLVLVMFGVFIGVLCIAPSLVQPAVLTATAAPVLVPPTAQGLPP